MSVSDFGALREYFGTSLLQRQYFYDSNGRLLYLGIAPKGQASSAPAWLIYTYTYNANNQVASETMAPRFSILDNRAALTYS